MAAEDLFHRYFYKVNRNVKICPTLVTLSISPSIYSRARISK